MKTLLLLLLMIQAAWGQATQFMAVCPTTPQTVNVAFTWAVNLSGQPHAGSQFTVIVPATATGVGVVSGAAAVAAGKTASFSNNIALFWGVNQNLIQPGQLAVITTTITSPGQYQLGITAPVGVGGGPDASPISTSANPPCAVSVSPVASKCDTNGDGVLNKADADLVDSWAHNNPAVPIAQCDKNADGSCNVIDVQIVANAAQGLPCTAI